MTNSTVDNAMICFLLISKIKDISINEIDIKSIRNLNENDDLFIYKCAKKYNLKCKITKLNKNKKTYQKFLNQSLPAIIKDNKGNPFILAKVMEEKAIIMKPSDDSPQIILLDELESMWDGDIIFIGKKNSYEFKESMFSFKWFIPTILKYKKEFIFVLLAVFTMQVLGLLTPIMTQVIIDKVLAHKSYSTLYVLTVGIILVYLFELILSLAKNYLFTHTTNRIDVLLNSKLFRHLFNLPLRYFETRRAGETIARVNELHNIRSFLTGTPLSSTIDLMFIIIYIVVLFMYNFNLTMIIIGSMILYGILSLSITPIFKYRLDEKFKYGARTSSFLVESIHGVQSVKSFALEDKFEDKWGDLQSDYVKASYKTSMLGGSANAVAQFIQKVFDLLILFYGSKLVMDGNFTVGQLVAFRMLSSKISTPVLRLVQLWQEYQQASLSVRRIGDIFNSHTEVKPSSGMNNLPKLEGEIEFHEVSFRYRSDASEAVKDLSFKTKQGEVIGIVGRSGSGKSTIAKLIQRLYLPEKGKITIDGLDLSIIDPKQLRGQIGVVLQENFMFNGTVKENISIHCPNVSMDKIVESAKLAGAHEFILSMGGYDTIIGEQGVGLSGGQKQRIAIARAIVNNPKILIFDEATSALDYETESIIQHNLKGICSGRTVLIIAHRLSTLKDVNRIMVVDQGQVKEYDTHENLMKFNGIYRKLYNQQKRGHINE